MSTVWLFSLSRKLLSPDELALVTKPFRAGPYPNLVVHGDCETGGGDRQVGTYASDRGIPVLRMPAQWERDGRSAGPKSNSEMVTVVSALVRCGWDAKVFAFPRPDSRGTRDLIRKAETAGLSVVVTELGGGK